MPPGRQYQTSQLRYDGAMTNLQDQAGDKLEILVATTIRR